MSEPATRDTEFDSRFSLPNVDDAPLTEVGIILMGLDAPRLLAGVGLATLADDPAQVTLAVDQLCHDHAAVFSLDALVAAGAARWVPARAALADAGLDRYPEGLLRRSWERAVRMATAVLPDAGQASVGYLVACWFRSDDVDRCAARVLEQDSREGRGAGDVVPEVTAG